MVWAVGERSCGLRPIGRASTNSPRLVGDESDFGTDVSALADAAQTALAADPKALEQEHFDLFIGVGRGELLPYGSYYLAGFLYEKPLGASCARTCAGWASPAPTGVHEPEDHIAAIMEMMSGLITGAFGGAGRSRHATPVLRGAPGVLGAAISSKIWKPRTCAGFYRSVGCIGRRFLAIESAAFEMTA